LSGQNSRSALSANQRTGAQTRSSRLRRAAKALLVVLLLALAGIQAILWSDLPRRIVVSQAQKQLGLHLEMSSLSTGWFGRTRLRNVAVSGPTDPRPILAVPVIDLEHAWLPWLLIGRPLSVSSVSLDRPHLDLIQDPHGRWNIQDLAELLTSATAEPDRPAPTAAPALPRIAVREAIVRIVRSDGRTTTVEPLLITGQPVDALNYALEADSPDQFRIEGRIALAGSWRHEITVRNGRLDSIAESWLGPAGPGQPVAIDGTWNGTVGADGLVGQLHLSQASALGFSAVGTLGAALHGGNWSLRPHGVIVRGPGSSLPPAELVSGEIDVAGDRLRAQRVRLLAMGGTAVVEGDWSFAGTSADMRATWDGLRQGDVVHDGAMTASLGSSSEGGPLVRAKVFTHGTIAESREWSAHLILDGHGRRWTSMALTALVNESTWKGPDAEPLSLPSFSLTALPTVDPDTGLIALIELADIRTHSYGSIDGAGRISPDSGRWWIWLNGRGVPLAGTPADIDLCATGDLARADVQQAFVQSRGLSCLAAGTIELTSSLPADLRIHVVREAEANQGRADGSLAGTLLPLDLAVNGRLSAHDLHYRDYAFGDAPAEVSGRITSTAIRLESPSLALLDGTWSAQAALVWGNAGDDAPEGFHLDLSVDDLPLPRVASTFGTADMHGTVDGRWSMIMPLHGPGRSRGQGEFAVRDLVAGPLKASSGSGKLRLEDGRLNVDSVNLLNGDGRASGTVSLALTSLSTPNIAVEAANWPIIGTGPDEHLRASGTARLHLDMAARGAVGEAAVALDVLSGNQLLAHATGDVHAEGRVIRLAGIRADLLQGQLGGDATLNLDSPADSIANLYWSGLQPSRLAPVHPLFGDVAGSYDGTIALGPAGDVLALAPRRVDISIRPAGGAFRGMPIGNAVLTVFLDPEKRRADPGSIRIAIADDVGSRDPQAPRSFVRFTDRGLVRVRGLFAAQRGVGIKGQLSLAFEQLSLDQIVHAFAGSSKTIRGRASGSLHLAGLPSQPDAISGEGTLRLTESDLINAPVIGQLYVLMNVMTFGPRADGAGTAEFRLERSTLSIERMQYFSRGVEIRSAGVKIHHIWDLPDSPLEGTAFGAARPLEGVRLPLIVNTERFLAALQKDVTAVEISGTARTPKTTRKRLADLSAGLRWFVLGWAKAAQADE
jgi:hypothetical protein